MPASAAAMSAALANARADLARCLDLEHDAVGPALKLVDDGAVGCLRVGVADTLMRLPAEAADPGVRAARERRQRRRRRLLGRMPLATRVDRLEHKAVGRLRHELLLEVGPLIALSTSFRQSSRVAASKPAASSVSGFPVTLWPAVIACLLERPGPRVCAAPLPFVSIGATGGACTQNSALGGRRDDAARRRIS